MTLSLRPTWPRTAAVAWLALAVAVAALAVAKPHAHTVYPIYKAAADRWLAGRSLYEWVPHYDYFRYAPGVAAAFVPLAALPDGVAGAVWRLLNAAAFAVAFDRWMRLALPKPLDATGRAVALLLTIPLAVGSLHNGQANPVVAALLLATATAAVGGRWNVAAFAAAAAAMLKVYPLALGLVLAALFPRRFAGPLVLALGTFVAVPFLAGKPAYVVSTYAEWGRHLVGERYEPDPQRGYRDVQMAWQTYVGPFPTPAYRAVEVAAGATVAGFAVWGQRRGWATRALLLRAVGLCTCWMLAFGPATEGCTYLLLAPPLAATLVMWTRDGRAWAWRGPLVAAAALQYLPVVAGAFPGGWRVQTLGPQPLSALLVAGLFVADGLRDRPAAAVVPLGRFVPRAA